MKYALQCLLLILLLSAGCQKETIRLSTPPSHPQPYYGYAVLKKNDRPYTVRVYACQDTTAGLPNRFMLFFDHYIKRDDDSERREYLQIGNIQCATYTTGLEDFVRDHTKEHIVANKKEWALYNTDDGDAIELPSSLDTSHHNFLEITSYNPATGEITGNITLAFLSYQKTYTTWFSEGSFYTKVY